MNSRYRRLLRKTLFGTALAGALTVGAFPVLDASYPLDLGVIELSASPVVRGQEGDVLARRVARDDQWREPLALSAMGRWLPLATIAIEDERFREHPGVDPRAVLRAALANLRAGHVVQGASTIHMQLIGMSLHTPRSLRGKAIEAFRALQLERALTKDGILERYLNSVPYGGNVVGASMAARAWFQKEPAMLSLDEAALLAGLPQGPERLRPDRSPDAARARRAAVLMRMEELGYITDREARAAKRAPLPATLHGGAALRGGEAQHLATWALGQRARGGRTTLKLDIQRELHAVIDGHRWRFPEGSDIAGLVIDVQDAALVALVGSADYGDPVDGQVDGTRAPRSPGSALKPFLYAAAIEAGMLAPDSVLEDSPLDLDGWRPSNFDGGTSGHVSASEALRRSLNLPAFRVARLAGLERCVGMLEGCGVRLPANVIARSGLALVTGGTEVSLFDLTTGYATLARGGEFVPTRLFMDEPLAPGTRIMREDTAQAIFQMLSDETRAPQVSSGPSHVGGLGFMWKTGTSSGFSDAWALGHDQRLAIGIWVGRFDGAGDPAFVGAEAAEPILAELFARLH